MIAPVSALSGVSSRTSKERLTFIETQRLYLKTVTEECRALRFPEKSRWVFRYPNNRVSGEGTPNSSKQNVKYNPATDKREKSLWANTSEVSDRGTGERNNKAELHYGQIQ